MGGATDRVFLSEASRCWGGISSLVFMQLSVLRVSLQVFVYAHAPPPCV